MVVYPEGGKLKLKFGAPMVPLGRFATTHGQHPEAAGQRAAGMGGKRIAPHGPLAKADWGDVAASVLSRSRTCARRLSVTSGGSASAGLAALGGMHA